MTPAESMLAAELADTLEAERAVRALPPNHCHYCGLPCYGQTCRAHTYLARIEKRARGEAA